MASAQSMGVKENIYESMPVEQIKKSANSRKSKSRFYDWILLFIAVWSSVALGVAIVSLRITTLGQNKESLDIAFEKASPTGSDLTNEEKDPLDLSLRESNISDRLDKRLEEALRNITVRLSNLEQQQSEPVQNISENLTAVYENLNQAVRSYSDQLDELREAVEDNTGKIATLKTFHRPNCKAILEDGNTASGIYTINIGGKVTKVFCDMETDGGGWIVFQRRFDGSMDFFRDWDFYQQGFGNVNGEFWLGLELLHQLTTSADYKLRVDLEDAENNQAYAEYRTFSVGPKSSSYQLTIGGYSGSAGDSMKVHNGQQFSTYDQDHDSSSGLNCAELGHGAWWYNECHNSNLNGNYFTSGNSNIKGVFWYHWKNDWESMKETNMKIRPL
ncbi:unnamed protein product [Clavelina lepadiformis]|uniref:Fibrinogen C-terminal domain-containing protein n=1 Tax=Clavelina lepadiformis TaxID=159417 RepID=A0ABP0FYR7_CLALP